MIRVVLGESFVCTYSGHHLTLRNITHCYQSRARVSMDGLLVSGQIPRFTQRSILICLLYRELNGESVKLRQNIHSPLLPPPSFSSCGLGVSPFPRLREDKDLWDPWFAVANHAELVILIKILNKLAGWRKAGLSRVWRNWGVGWIQMAAAKLIGSSNPN